MLKQKMNKRWKWRKKARDFPIVDLHTDIKGSKTFFPKVLERKLTTKCVGKAKCRQLPFYRL